MGVKLYVGTDSWGSQEWIDSFYPKNSQAQNLLQLYSETFNFIELRSSHFYYDPSQIRKWIDSVIVNSFRFSPWAPRIFMYDKNPQRQAASIANFVENWKECGDKLGPIGLPITHKYSTDRRDRLYRLIENAPRGNLFVLNINESSWHEPTIFNDLIDHAKKNGIGVIRHENENFQKITLKYLYLKINLDHNYEIEKLLTNIPQQIEDVYISVSGTDKLKVLERLKNLQSFKFSK